MENKLSGGNKDEELSLSDDNEALGHIKNVILKQLNKLENTKQHGAGGCGCDKNSNPKKGGGGRRSFIIGSSSTSDSSSDFSTDSSYSTSDSSEYGIKKAKKLKKSKKSKKSKKNKFLESASSKYIVDSSESVEVTSNNEASEEGLSIFPFNSSDVKSSASVKNYKMLRRKI